MPGYTALNAQYAIGGDAAAIHTVSQNLADSMTPMVVGSVASTSARNTAYATTIASGKKGMVCYVQDRDGWAAYRGNAWVWLPYATPMYDGYWAGPANQTGAAPAQTLLTSGSITVPGTGQRRIGITASCNMEVFSGGEVGARAQVVGATGVALPGMSMGQNYLQNHVDQTGALSRHTASRTWNIVLNGGTQTFTLEGLNEGSLGTVMFTHMTLQVEDRGPYN